MTAVRAFTSSNRYASRSAAAGFVMIAVVVTLLLCAALALMLTTDSAREAERARRGVEDLEAYYAAQAALEHAAWLSQRSTCSNYALPSTPFGAHSYAAVYGPTSGSPTAIKASATLASGVTRLASRAAAPVHNLAATTTIVLAPSQDTYINEDNITDNKGIDAELRTDSETGKRHSALLQFDLSALPPNIRVTSATLEVLVTGVSGVPDIVALHALTQPWTELGATWSTRNGADPWSAPGGDYVSRGEDAVTVDTVGWRTFDVTGLAQAWSSNALQNNGIILTSEPAAGNNEKKYHSREHSVAGERPKLTISYSCECGVVCTRPASTKDLLFVVGDSGNMAPVDAEAERVFSEWGFNVQVRDDGQNFGGSLNSNDVIYVSETVDSTVLGTKLNSATAGIVSAKGPSNDELGFATGWAAPVGSTVEILDNTHYITSPFPTGALEIYTVDIAGLSVFGVTSLQLTALARSGLYGSLVLLDTGELSATGAPVAGRRVMVPIGAAPGFSWSRLNNNGRLLLQRALQWAGDGSASSSTSQLWLSTKADVSASGAPGLDAWTDGEVLAFADPGLAFEPGTTGGTFSVALSLDGFADDGDVDIDALHRVGVDITVGSLNSMDLQVGDLLVSTRSDETLTSSNTLTVASADVFVFRPLAPNDYSAGLFFLLIDGSEIHNDNTVGISLVEAGTTVGDEVLAAGSFLMTTTSSRDVFEFTATDVGLNTTAGDLNIFIDGIDMDIGAEIHGVELVEEDTALGGQSIPAGSILLTLDGSDAALADNALAVDRTDLFYLVATKAGEPTEATAVLLFEGADVNFDAAEENLHALTFGTSLNAGLGPVSLDVQVAAGSDDAEEAVGSGTMYIESTDLELVVDNLIITQLVGLRFANVNVPQGANITNAYVQFQTDETASGVASLLVEGQASDNAAAFEDANYNISSRPRTLASAVWVPPPWSAAGEAGPDQQTPDLGAVIQEIVDRPGWASGNALAIIISGTGTRTAEAYEGDPAGAATLHIEYDGFGGGGAGGGGAPANFGFETEFPSSQNNVRRLQIATQVTLPEDGTATSITAYVGGDPDQVRYAIYADQGGEPGALLAETQNVTTSSDMNWIAAELPATALTAGTYWLALSFNDLRQQYQYDAGGETRYNGNRATQSGFSSTWGPATASYPRSISIYGTYIPSD